jgi:hypothetical protein
MPDDQGRSRRALLLGAATGVTALAVDALARSAPVAAADGDPLLLGQENEADKSTRLKSGNSDVVLEVDGAGTDGIVVHSDSKTGLSATSEAHVAVQAESAGPEGVGVGVYGKSTQFIAVLGEGGREGVHGYSLDGDGVRGISAHGTGVAADCDSGWGMLTTSVSGGGLGAVSVLRSGVEAMSDAVVDDARELVDVAGVYGRSTEPGYGKPGQGPLGSGLGVLGRSGTGVGVRGESTGPGGVGIEGRTSGPESIGVLGGSPHTGIHGWGERIGVEGKTQFGVGVVGHTQDGIAVSADIFPGGTGVAVAAHGPVVFDSAGLVTIPKDARSVTVTSPVALVQGSSKILVTLMVDPAVLGKKGVPPDVLLSHVEIRSSATFDIVLKDKASQPVDAAYFVIR